MAKGILERVTELELKVQGLEAMRSALEWLGATIQGQTEALNIVVEELGSEFGQKVAANHARRQEVRRQEAIQQAKDALKQLIDAGILTETDTIEKNVMLVGVVTKDDVVVQEHEAGILENFPQECQDALLGKTVGATWDGPKGVLKIEKIYAFKKAEPKKVADLSSEDAPALALVPTEPAQATEGNAQ